MEKTTITFGHPPIADRSLAIHEPLIAEVSATAALIQQQERILDALRNDLRHTLLVGQGVDVTAPGWHIDLVHCALVHVPAQMPQPQAEASGS